MRLKFGVQTDGVRPETWYAIGVAEIVYRDENHQLVVTSLVDGEHKKDSLHYKGLAADIRTRDLKEPEKQKILTRLKYLLEPQGYDVLIEADHIHIEFDPKAGEQWEIRVA